MGGGIPSTVVALAQDFSEAPAWNLPVLTSAEVARVSPFIPKRTLRLVQAFVDTVEQEAVVPMLRQPTYVEATEVLEKNLHVVIAVRRLALGLLISDALKNPVLRGQLETGIDIVREEVRSADAELFAGESGAVLDDALSVAHKSTHDLLRLLSPRWEKYLARRGVSPELESTAARIDTMLVALITGARSADRPRWFAELIVALREVVRSHAQMIYCALFEIGRDAQYDVAIQSGQTPDERSAAIEDVLVAFECPAPESVRAFLSDRPDVFEVLREAVPELERHFGDARRRVELIPAESWGEQHLAIRIVVPDRRELSARRDASESEWWSHHAHRANGGLVIAVRPS